MRTVIALPLVLAFLATSGCLGLGEPSIQARIVLGQVAIIDHEARATYDALARVATVDLHASLRAVDARGMLVRSFLTTRPCATLVNGRADSWLDKRVLAFADADGAVDLPFQLKLNATLAPGEPLAVVTRASASNVIGLDAYECADLVALPARADDAALRPANDPVGTFMENVPLGRA